MLHYKIIAGSSASVPAIKTDSIHHIFTSPPYGKIKPYDRDNPYNIGNYEKDEYFAMMKSVYKECYRILQPGRKMIVNITDMVDYSTKDDKIIHYPYGQGTVDICKEIGFELEMTIIWCKNKSRTGEVGGTFPYPANPVLIHDWEYCYLFRKPGKADYSHVTKEQREVSRMSPQFMHEVMYNSWHLMGESNVDFHIAAFPVQLPMNGIALYSFAGEIVYDPFLGSGTTVLAAKILERSGIGCEIGYKTEDEKPWIEHTKKRIGWLDGSLHGEQILYEIIDTEGKILESKDVEGKGKLILNVLNQAEIMGKPLDKFEIPKDIQDAVDTMIEIGSAIGREAAKAEKKKKKEPEEDKNQQRLF